MGWEVENQQILRLTENKYPKKFPWDIYCMFLDSEYMIEFNQNLIKNWDEKWKINKLVDFMACNYG